MSSFELWKILDRRILGILKSSVAQLVMGKRNNVTNSCLNFPMGSGVQALRLN